MTAVLIHTFTPVLLVCEEHDRLSVMQLAQALIVGDAEPELVLVEPSNLIAADIAVASLSRPGVIIPCLGDDPARKLRARMTDAVGAGHRLIEASWDPASPRRALPAIRRALSELTLDEGGSSPSTASIPSVSPTPSMPPVASSLPLPGGAPPVVPSVPAGLPGPAMPVPPTGSAWPSMPSPPAGPVVPSMPVASTGSQGASRQAISRPTVTPPTEEGAGWEAPIPMGKNARPEGSAPSPQSASETPPDASEQPILSATAAEGSARDGRSRLPLWTFACGLIAGGAGMWMLGLAGTSPNAPDTASAAPIQTTVEPPTTGGGTGQHTGSLRGERKSQRPVLDRQIEVRGRAQGQPTEQTTERTPERPDPRNPLDAAHPSGVDAPGVSPTASKTVPEGTTAVVDGSVKHAQPESATSSLTPAAEGSPGVKPRSGLPAAVVVSDEQGGLQIHVPTERTWDDTWNRAMGHCKRLDPSAPGEWRLPTRSEFHRIAQSKTLLPRDMWTASKVSSDATKAYLFRYRRGFFDKVSKSRRARFVCVRDGEGS